MDDSTSVLATVFTLPISVRVTAVNLADIPRCVACVLFWVHLFETFDCVYFQRSCNVTNLERVNLLQEQVAATLLDPHNMPDLNCIPLDQHDQGWALLRNMVIAVIDAVKKSGASSDVNDSIEDVNDFFLNQWSTLPSMSYLVSSLLTLRLHLNDCDFDSRPLLFVSLFLSLYIHIGDHYWSAPWFSNKQHYLSTQTRIHIVTIILYYIPWYWQNRHQPEFRLKRLLVCVALFYY